ncbi:MAG: hypothetical protein ACTSP3_03300 [Candidatus Heimdallarchaeaceae archaeon]
MIILKEADYIFKLKEFLQSIFVKVTNELSPNSSINDKNLDGYVLNLINSYLHQTEEIKVKVSEPVDDIYKSSAGRTPYDILIFGDIENIPFKILLNNKYGEIDSNRRNDTTTYNNLLRLYLDIQKQRVKKGICPNYDTIKRRINGEEILTYALYVFDKNSRKHNFFFLEEVDEDFYINPRNSMFQIKYNPRLRREPMTYLNFVKKLVLESNKALKKRIESAEEEKTMLGEYFEKLVYLNNEKEI